MSSSLESPIRHLNEMSIPELLDILDRVRAELEIRFMEIS